MKNDRHNTNTDKRNILDTESKKRSRKRRRKQTVSTYDFYCACNKKRCEGICREKHLNAGKCPAAYDPNDRSWK